MDGIGFTNTSLYMGDIDYVALPSQGTYWILPLNSTLYRYSRRRKFLGSNSPSSDLNVNGNSVSLPSGRSSYAAIDTGTTLVGGPSSIIKDLYSQIPGAQAGSGNFEGYYIYRMFSCSPQCFRGFAHPLCSSTACQTNVTVQLGFGNSSRTWPISPDDFMLSELDQGECLGAFFELTGGGSAPPWIIGDTFLVRRLRYRNK
jgi:hypothetical protein